MGVGCHRGRKWDQNGNRVCNEMINGRNITILWNGKRAFIVHDLPWKNNEKRGLDLGKMTFKTGRWWALMALLYIHKHTHKTPN
jgi:hypothetical protein